MPLEPYKRGNTWWVKGRIEFNGRPISDYIRTSTGASTEAGARQWIQEEIDRQTRAAILGVERALTWDDAVLLYPAKPAEAKYLIKLQPHLSGMALAEITPRFVRRICPEIYPNASSDTWRRQVIGPVSAVINNMHDTSGGASPPIKIRSFSAQERIDQDAKRGKQSRQPRRPGDWPWIRQVQTKANPYLSAALEFMFETGARIGQVIAVTPNDVDLATSRVRLIAQKGHPAQWVAISKEMTEILRALPPRRPRDTKRRNTLDPRVFGYANRTGLTAALRHACKAAGVDYRSPHAAGRHGFYTELRVRQGVDPVTAAKAGRWSNAALPDSVYAHAEHSDSQIRALIRTNSVQRDDE